MKVGEYWKSQQESTINSNSSVIDSDSVLSSSSQEPVYVTVFDIVVKIEMWNLVTGRSFQSNVSNNILNLKNIDIGVYLIEINTQSGGIYRTKILILASNSNLVFLLNETTINILRTESENDSFVSTDRLKFRLNVIGNINNELLKSIEWNIIGVTENDGNGASMSANAGTFEFNPNPRNRLTNGARIRNLPIRYKLSATLLGLKTEIVLIQDEIDILRQEYIDYDYDFKPSREQIYLSENSEWNTGNYSYIAAEANNRFEEIFNAYNEAWILYCQVNNINSTGLSFGSAFRNPQRNRAVGGSRNSRHARGRALDLSPIGNHGLGGGIWSRIKQVGIILNYDANCDRSGTFVNQNCSSADHIHVQW
jgi:hypothetical protein